MSDWEELLVDRLANAGYLASAIDEDGDHVTLIDAPAGDVIRVVAEALLSDEAIERAARAVAGLEPGEDWPTNEQMGGGPTGTRDDEYRSECVRTARAALTAALGEEEE